MKTTASTLSRFARVGLAFSTLMASLAGWSGAAVAQSAADQVNRLTDQAMEAYNNLDIDTAGNTLVQAIELAQQSGVGGAPLARANLNLGIVYVGGLGDNSNGMVYFLAAVCADRNVQLDPLTSTPDIQTVFQLAQQRAQSGGCQGSSAPAPGPGPQPGPTTVGPSTMPGPAQSSGELIHFPPTEQKTQTPLPLYVEAPMPDVQKVQLYYKGLGMDAFKRVEMLPFGAGYAFQISCQDVWEPRVVYYINVTNGDGRVIAAAGSAAAPIEVAVVSGTPSSVPALPDTAPPTSCAADECPPGLAGCAQRGIAAIGEPCSASSDCQGGLFCGDDVCQLLGAGESEPEDSGPARTDFARFFLQVGGALGFAGVQAGMQADGGPPAGVDPWRGPWVPDGNSSQVTDGDFPSSDECPAKGRITGPGERPDGYCVSVGAGGLVMNTAVRAALGYFLTESFSVAAIVRYQPDHGGGQLPGMLLGGRLELLLTTPKATGLSVSMFAGGSFGTIHVKPAPKDPQWEKIAPYVISGLSGAHVGSNIRFRFARNFGLFIAPEIDVQFPLFMFNLDMTAGLELAL